MRDELRRCIALVIVLTYLVFGFGGCGGRNIVDREINTYIGGNVVDLEINTYITEKIVGSNIPGMAVEVACGTKPCFSMAYGYADIEKRIPARVDTLWLLASISKAIASTSVMQMVEQGKLSLDTDINQYLPFPVRNPVHPDVPITLRMLMTHRSSILDNMELLESLVVEGDSPIPLGTFLKGYLISGGEYYTNCNFSSSAPGKEYKYSNVSSSLAAFIVEYVSGVPFDEYSTRYTLEPLMMKESGWHLKDVEGLCIATPYGYDKALRKNIPLPQSGWPDYPDSALRTSAPQLLRFLMAYVNGGTLDGARILESATVKEMLRIQDPENDQGLIWYYEKDASGNWIFGHSGSDTGVRTQMFARVKDGVGVVILTNADFENDEAKNAIKEIRDKLFSVDWNSGYRRRNASFSSLLVIFARPRKKSS